MNTSSTKFQTALIVSLGVLAALLCQAGILPARFSAHVMALPIMLIFIVFWPLCMLAIRRAGDRSTLAPLGPLLYAGIVVTLMLTTFGKPFALGTSAIMTVPQLAGPAFWAGMLVGWFTVEGLQLAGAGQPVSQQPVSQHTVATTG
jgi:hypothetical protein